MDRKSRRARPLGSIVCAAAVLLLAQAAATGQRGRIGGGILGGGHTLPGIGHGIGSIGHGGFGGGHVGFGSGHVGFGGGHVGFGGFGSHHGFGGFRGGHSHTSFSLGLSFGFFSGWYGYPYYGYYPGYVYDPYPVYYPVAAPYPVYVDAPRRDYYPSEPRGYSTAPGGEDYYLYRRAPAAPSAPVTPGAARPVRDPALEDAIDHIETAFLRGDAELLARHVDLAGTVAVVSRGYSRSPLSGAAYLDTTREAFKTMHTLRFSLDRVEPASNGAVMVSGEHVVREDATEKRYNVHFVLRRQGDRYVITEVSADREI